MPMDSANYRANASSPRIKLNPTRVSKLVLLLILIVKRGLDFAMNTA
jgi:hypothetical protein